jgi:hypothetical protein
VVARRYSVLIVNSDIGQFALNGDRSRRDEQHGRIDGFDEKSLRCQTFDRWCCAELKLIPIIARYVLGLAARPAPRAATKFIERNAAPA